MWASKERGMEKSRQTDVGNVLPVPDEEPSILLPAD
jgi:hypothetical protein